MAMPGSGGVGADLDLERCMVAAAHDAMVRGVLASTARPCVVLKKSSIVGGCDKDGTFQDNTACCSYGL
jgi:hypothetical protein